MDLSRQIDEIEEQGFSVIHGVVSQQSCAELRRGLEFALEEDMKRYGHLPGKEDFIVHDLVSYGGPFLELLENETMHQVFSHFLGEHHILYGSSSTILPPYDSDNVPYTAKIHVDTPRWIEGYQTGMLMTVAVDEFTDKNGATLYLPGSHKSPARPSDEYFYANAVSVSRPAGSVVLFSARVWHTGGANHSGKARYGCSVYACCSWMKQRFDYPRLVSSEIVNQLGPRGRAFLGFDARVPTCMEDYYVPPEERLYRSGQG